MEDSSVVNFNSKDKISNNLNSKISELQHEINSLTQKISDCTVKKSQN